jgi:sterol desaturase/sphingolipid hydroxylase (fatty acid hydroxylase superfamily)
MQRTPEKNRLRASANKLLSFLSFEQGRLAYRADFALYGIAVVGLTTLLVIRAPQGSGLGLTAMCAAGLTAWTLIEYLFHRFLLHRLSPFREWHAKHHARPSERIASPTLFSASLIVVLVYLPGWLLVGAWASCALTLGVTTGYLAYAVVHHATHHWRASRGWLKGRKRWHAAHHHGSGQERCFGVTSSFWDQVFGTC